METQPEDKHKTPEEFVEELDRSLRQATGRSRLKTLPEAAQSPQDISEFLRSALQSEMEAIDISALWLTDTKENDIKLALARQIGDESRHYRVLEDRLRILGQDKKNLELRNEPPSPLFNYLKTLKDPVERIAAGPFARAGVNVVKNEELVKFALSRSDEMTAHIFTEMIQEDEKFHHELAKQLLKKYCTSPEIREKVKSAVQKTIALSEELQELASIKLGGSSAPSNGK